jgi:hypothetical protein
LFKFKHLHLQNNYTIMETHKYINIEMLKREGHSDRAIMDANEIAWQCQEALDYLATISPYEFTMSISMTDYGTSGYLTACTWDQATDKCATYKIRISDHEATNSVRRERELMFDTRSFGISPNGAIAQEIERYVHPERFKKVVMRQYTGRTKSFNFPADTVLNPWERVVREWTAKSGRAMVTAEWDEFTTTVEWVRL